MLVLQKLSVTLHFHLVMLCNYFYLYCQERAIRFATYMDACNVALLIYSNASWTSIVCLLSLL